jgi:hypothetical protein
MVRIEPVHFTKRNQHGDFEYMIEQPEYADSLFLIQENVVDSLTSDNPGAGTACLRPYTYRLVSDKTRPRAAAIPTGWNVDSGGFTELSKAVKSTIHVCMQRIRLLLQKYDYKSVVFSCDKDDTTKIGQGIFEIAKDVLTYISDQIWSLMQIDSPNDSSSDVSHNELNMRERFHVLPFALRQQVRTVKLENYQLEKDKKELQAENVKLRAALASSLGTSVLPSPLTPLKRKL